MNNNAMESWNNWMRSLRIMPIPWLLWDTFKILGRSLIRERKRCNSGRMGSKQRLSAI